MTPKDEKGQTFQEAVAPYADFVKQLWDLWPELRQLQEGWRTTTPPGEWSEWDESVVRRCAALSSKLDALNSRADHATLERAEAFRQERERVIKLVRDHGDEYIMDEVETLVARIRSGESEGTDETVTQHLGGSTSASDKPCAPAWTPGPWVPDQFDCVYGVNDQVAVMTGDWGPIRRANARLTAKAPELYDGLQSLVNEARGFLSMADVTVHSITNIRVMERKIADAELLLAKARGEA